MTPNTPSQQLALAMFADLGLEDVKVADAPSDIGFHKSKELVAIQDLSLVGRRAINALHFIAAEAPTKLAWDVDLGYFKWLAAFSGSRNDKHLKDALREAQKAAIVINIVDAVDSRKDAFISVPMLGTFVMARGRLSFKLPDEIKTLLRAPTNAQYLSLRIGGVFTSSYAYTLYEHMLEVREAGESDWLPITEVREWFKASDKKSLQEYKFLKRDVLTPAIKQINKLSDISVTLEERRELRRVAFVRFTVRNNSAFLKRNNTIESELQKLYQVLSEEFGLANSDFEVIMDDRDRYTNERIASVIELVRHRSQQQRIGRPAAYFMKMLKEGVVLSTIEKKSTEKKNAPKPKAATNDQLSLEQSSAAEAKTSRERAMGEQIFGELDDAGKESVWREFAVSLVGKSALNRLKLSADISVDEALAHDAIRAGLFSVLSQAGKASARAKRS